MSRTEESETQDHHLGKPHVLAAQTIRALKYVTFRSNPWRPDPQLSSQNLEIDACIAAGGSGMVFRGRNKDTNIQYAFKVSRQRYDKQTTTYSPEGLEGDPSPSLTRSTGASIVNSELMYPLSLGLKREREARTYLRYIKTGHINVCNFEAYCEFDILGSRRFLHVFELCDAGTLFDIIRTYIRKGGSPPETFIWRVFEQLFDALAFLHGEHPLYKDNPEFQPPRSTVVLDIKEDNIFFKWPQEKTKHYYPDLKLGDFGSCIHLPVGGQRESDLFNVVSEPPEYMISAKYDVWCGGSMIYYMAKLGFRPNLTLPSYMEDTSRNREILREDPKRIEQSIDDHLSGWLEADIKYALTMDPDERPTAWEMVQRIRSGSHVRRSLQYRPLPDWVHLDYFLDQKLNPSEIARSVAVESESEDPEEIETEADAAEIQKKKVEQRSRRHTWQGKWHATSVSAKSGEWQKADTAQLITRRRILRRTRKFRAYRPIEYC
ncbi:Calmodulin-dependent protein kinase cmk2 [Clarireedia jacksonii]